ncbi:DnaJ-domain-containing protein, partial [Patellaria atrata CBS 101060]
MSSHVDDLTDEPPGSINPYEVLEIEKSATAHEVKTAYRKAALQHHPDKVKPEDKEAANQRFQEIAFAYAILSDERRRARYDKTGRTEESVQEDDDFNWHDFFSTQFQDMVNEDKIAKVKAEYQGSDEEKRDLLAAYTKYKGRMSQVFQVIMLSNPLEDEERFRAIIDAAIKDGNVDSYPQYTNETKAGRKRRMDEAMAEAGEAEELAKELGVHEKVSRSRKRKTKKGNTAEQDESDLMALIQQRAKDRASQATNFLDSLAAKYTPKPKNGKKREASDDEPSEEAFQETAEKLN